MEDDFIAEVTVTFHYLQMISPASFKRLITQDTPSCGLMVYRKFKCVFSISVQVHALSNKLSSPRIAKVQVAKWNK